MPHTKSAFKRMKQNELRKARNRRVTKVLRTTNKQTLTAISSGDGTAALDAFKQSQMKLDKAADQGYIHKNKASRLKSRMAKKLKAMSGSAAK